MFDPSQRRIAVLAYPGVQVLDVTGPLQVFCHAGYPVEVIGLDRGPLAVSAGFQIVASRGFAEVDPCNGDLDTLLVAGGIGVHALLSRADLADWLRRAAPAVRRFGSVCTGAFLLGAAGLLDGRRAVTHWAHCERFRAAFPQVRLEPDALHVADGNIHTSAGVTAGMDLALALVERDLGHRRALEVARHLVLFLKRPGGQSQFSAHLDAGAPDGSPVRAVQDWVRDNPGADLRVDALAARCAMSPRNFARVFSKETGTTPQRFVEAVRLEEARRRLERTRGTIDRIAAECGFGSAETMRRAFLRRFGVPPQDYRVRFRAAHGAREGPGGALPVDIPMH